MSLKSTSTEPTCTIDFAVEQTRSRGGDYWNIRWTHPDLIDDEVRKMRRRASALNQTPRLPMRCMCAHLTGGPCEYCRKQEELRRKLIDIVNYRKEWLQRRC